MCHRPGYEGRDQVPRLAGQLVEVLAAVMVGYRDGTRVGADSLMNGAVFGRSDAGIAALAPYLAQRDWPPGAVAARPGTG
ncbi:hypothetical protein [Roseomonas sp. HF4]|uniref:c-type cytochrome n=1 Tax=Roseomonas sp. HF4 TaxID=2562313 RepID=UPI0010C0FE05|nr:hypothetical protein [Roseomonas sp. HF4]